MMLVASSDPVSSLSSFLIVLELDLNVYDVKQYESFDHLVTLHPSTFLPRSQNISLLKYLFPYHMFKERKKRKKKYVV